MMPTLLKRCSIVGMASMRSFVVGIGAAAILLASGSSGYSQNLACAQFKSSFKGGPAILIYNGCRNQIDWKLCINVSTRPFRDFASGTTAPGATSRYGFSVGSKRFKLRYEWTLCEWKDGKACVPATLGGC